MTSILSIITRYCLYALLIFTPLAHGAVQGWAITIVHLVTLIALTSLLFEKGWTWEWKWIKTPLDKPIALLFILSILSLIFSVHRLTSFWSMILLTNYIIIFYLVIHTLKTRSQLRHLIYIIIAVATFMSVFGLMTKFGNNPFPWWDYSHLKRSPEIVSSTYVNPNNFAGYLEMAIPLTLALFLTGIRGAKRVLVAYLSILLLVGLIISLSRGGWISAMVGLAFMGSALLANPYFERKKLLLTCTLVACFLALIVLANRSVVVEIGTLTGAAEEPSLQSRVVVWGETVNMTLDRPLLGNGPGTFSTLFTQYQPPGLTKRFFMAHNDYLHFISEVGIFLVPIIVWMVIAFYRKGFKKLKNPSRLIWGTTLGAMSGITAILFHSIVEFNLHIPANAILFTVLAGIVVSPTPKIDKPFWELDELEREKFLLRESNRFHYK